MFGVKDSAVGVKTVDLRRTRDIARVPCGETVGELESLLPLEKHTATIVGLSPVLIEGVEHIAAILGEIRFEALGKGLFALG